MARGVEAVAPLPKVSFVKIDDDTLSKPAGVADNTARGFGCAFVSFAGGPRVISRVRALDNDGSEFQRPDHYIRYSGRMVVPCGLRNLTNVFPEPLEKELAVQVEYDMDEQGAFVNGCLGVPTLMFWVDMEWLDNMNAERKKEQGDRVSYETFEIIMDRLEKDWFDLVRFHHPQFPAFASELCRQTKNLPKPDMAMPSEDSTCAICDDSEGENTNAIVFCDGCNLAVHQDCYGVPYIPEGQWLCRKCTVSPETPVVRSSSLYS